MQTPQHQFVAGSLPSTTPNPSLPNAGPPITWPSTSGSTSSFFFPPSLVPGTQIGPSLTPLPAKSEPNPDPPLDGLDDGFESDSDNDDPTVFKIRGALQEPTYHRFTTEELHRLIHESEIDLNPPYQRDVVWNEPKQVALIDSIFRNYYIPPIVFAVQRDDDGEEIRVCVDGKQRLTSIQKFMDGQISHKDMKSKRAYWYTVPDNLMKQRQMLPDTAKRIFASKKMTCMEYRGLTAGTERDIFQRVQMGMTLSAAGKWNQATVLLAHSQGSIKRNFKQYLLHGQSQGSQTNLSWITQLESKHVGVDGGLTAVLDWDVKRGRDFQNIAYLVCCCDGLPTVEQVPTNQKMEKWLSRVDPPVQSFKVEIEEVLRDFWKIASDRELKVGLDNGKRLAPVEFIFIGVMLYVLRKRSIRERSAAISYLRDTVRAEFRDIRTNGVVAKFLWGIIRKLERGDVPALQYVREKKGKKRKDHDFDDDDSDYRPGPVTELGKTLSTRSRQSRKG